MEREHRPALVMSDELFDQIISEICEWEVKPDTIWLNMNGEPLSDPRIVDRLALIKSRGLGSLVTLQTNAHFLTEEKAAAILEADIRNITIGFDGATRETYAAHRVRCDYDGVLANFKRFAKMRDDRKMPTRISVQYVRTKKNEHEVLDAYRMFNEFLDPELDVFQDNLAKDWGDKPANTGIFYVDKFASDKTMPCQLLSEQMVISSDGKLAACCWDYNLTVSDGGFGNISAGLLTTWRGPKRRKVEQIVLNGALEERPKKCQTCVFSFDIEMIDPSLAKMTGPLATQVFAGFAYKFERPAPRLTEPSKGFFDRLISATNRKWALNLGRASNYTRS